MRKASVPSHCLSSSAEMSFKIASRFCKAALIINDVPVDKFPLLLNRIFQKLHLKTRLFSEEEEAQLKKLFQFSDEDLKLVLDCCCYIFEQAAFTSTGPEPLYDILLEAGFDEPHGKVIGRSWATEAGGYIAKLKTETVNYDTLQSNTYHLNMVMAQSGLTRLQEPTAFFELTLSNHEKKQQAGDAPAEDKLCLEFSHSELYGFFSQLDRIQKQLDSLSAS